MTKIVLIVFVVIFSQSCFFFIDRCNDYRNKRNDKDKEFYGDWNVTEYKIDGIDSMAVINKYGIKVNISGSSVGPMGYGCFCGDPEFYTTFNYKGTIAGADFKSKFKDNILYNYYLTFENITIENQDYHLGFYELKKNIKNEVISLL